MGARTSKREKTPNGTRNQQPNLCRELLLEGHQVLSPHEGNIGNISNRNSRLDPNTSTSDINRKYFERPEYAPSAPVMDNDDSMYRPRRDLSGVEYSGFRREEGLVAVSHAAGFSSFPRSDSNQITKNGKKACEQKVYKPIKNCESNKQDKRHCEKKSSSAGNGDQPPKYEDVVRESQGTSEAMKRSTGTDFENTLSLTARNSQLGKDDNPKKLSSFQHGIIKVDQLNDLIKKKFGSVGGPIPNLGNVDMTPKPFPGINRLFIRNLPSDIDRRDLENLLSSYSEITVDFINKEKRMCCVRLKHGAKIAQCNLDRSVFKGRLLRVHFDNRNVRFKVLNISPWVTSELLKTAFSIFGEVEIAEVLVDGNGQPTGEGYLEFAHKKGGEEAYEACKENCFLLTASARPVILEKIKVRTPVYSEALLPRRDPNCRKDREVGPRFVAEGSPEYKCAMLWKELLEKQRVSQKELANKFQIDEDRILTQIETMQRR